MFKSCLVQWWLWYVDGYDYLGMLRKSARAKEGRRYRAKIVLVFCVCWRSQYWKFNQMIEHDIFSYSTYRHMEWHADICKSLVYKYRERQRKMLRQNKRRSVLNKAGALWIKRLKHTLVIFGGKGNSSFCNTKDVNNHRKCRPEVFDVFIICGLLLILVVIINDNNIINCH